MEPEVMLTWNRRITRQSTVSIETFPDTETVTVVATSYQAPAHSVHSKYYIDRLAQELMIVWFGFRKETIMVLCNNYNKNYALCQYNNVYFNVWQHNNKVFLILVTLYHYKNLCSNEELLLLLFLLLLLLFHNTIQSLTNFVGQKR